MYPLIKNRGRFNFETTSVFIKERDCQINEQILHKKIREVYLIFAHNLSRICHNTV
jgi:hypothetical protein